MKQATKIKAAILAMSLCQGLQYTISPVLNQVQEAYPQVSVDLIQMLVTAPALMTMVGALISSWLVKYLSKKKILFIAAMILGVGGFLPFLAENFTLLFVARTILGIGLGLNASLVPSVVAEHFDGQERVLAMGFQGAGVGSGMLLASVLGGILGSYGYQYIYWIHILGFASAIMLWILLPDTGRTIVAAGQKARANKAVYLLCLVGIFEVFFMMTFTTNIAMHLSGELTGDATVAGNLTGIFSAIQIVVGLFLSVISRYFKKHTLSAAMLSFGIGCILLVLFPASYPILVIAAVFCGISQGIFVPRIMVEGTEAVPPYSATLVSSILIICMNLAQFISPSLVNSLARLVFGEVTTTNVYILGMVGMICFPIIRIILHSRKQMKKGLPV